MTVELEFKHMNELPESANNPYAKRREMIFEIVDFYINGSVHKDVDEIIIKVIPKTLVKQYTSSCEFINKENDIQ